MIGDTKAAPLTDEVLLRVREFLAGRESIGFSYLFGSYPRERATPFSDIDIAVYLEEGCPREAEKIEILSGLMEVAGSDEIDLVILNTAPLTLQARVVSGGEVLVDKIPSARHSFESLVLRKYFDFSILEGRILRRRFSHDGQEPDS